jgi:pyruvate dehydrogenase E2 component (dihydrolipoamide acetyltransferase)
MAARACARQVGVALEDIAGSGPGGRVVRADVERVAALGSPPTSDRVPAPAPRAAPALGGHRRAIADHLQLARDRCVPLTVNRFAPCNGLIRLRRTLANAAPDTPPTLTECAAVVVARILVGHPTLNGTIRDDGSGLDLAAAVTLGIAVDTEEGLIVPTIADAHLLGVTAFAGELRAKVLRARARRASAADLANGTFTLTNLGQLDVDFGTPVLNWPQVAILGLGRVRGQDGEHEMGLSLTVDHKFIDGVPAARFLRDVAAAFEEPGWVLR